MFSRSSLLLSQRGWYESEAITCLREYLERSKNYVSPFVEIECLPEEKRSKAEKIWKTFLLKFGEESKTAYEKVQVVVEQNWDDVSKTIPNYVPKESVRMNWLQGQYFEIVSQFIAEDKAGQQLNRQQRQYKTYLYLYMNTYGIPLYIIAFRLLNRRKEEDCGGS